MLRRHVLGHEPTPGPTGLGLVEVDLALRRILDALEALQHDLADARRLAEPHPARDEFLRAYS